MRAVAVREARYLTWPSWPDPETCDEFITIAIFSSGTWNRSDAEVKAALGDGGCHHGPADRRVANDNSVNSEAS